MQSAGIYGQVPDNQGKHINTAHPVLRAPFFNAEGKEFINNEVKELQCGNDHCLALTKGGDVWSFGRNDRVLHRQRSHSCHGERGRLR
jgi:alpha-tubulin suppressor-like RCC1 family protein